MHIICVYSNANQYQSRLRLTREFLHRIHSFTNHVYVVELSYHGELFEVTQKHNPFHLQLHSDYILWNKENLINIAIRTLLPTDWKYVAWIDSDIEFQNPDWISLTVSELQKFDVVQMFSCAQDLGPKGDVLKIHRSFAFQWNNRSKDSDEHVSDSWHPGYAWACTRHAYDTLGGLFEEGILGGGDRIMALCLIQKIHSFENKVPPSLFERLLEYQENLQQNPLSLGHVPQTISHHFHGYKKNRYYQRRWTWLQQYDFDPVRMLSRNSSGLCVPTEHFPQGLLDKIKEYFSMRQEDEEEWWSNNDYYYYFDYHYLSLTLLGCVFLYYYFFDPSRKCFTNI